MPWSQEFSDCSRAETIRRRLAWYVHLRIHRHGNRGRVCEAVGISRDTLRNYAFYNFPKNDTRYGPTNFDVFLRIVDYFQDNISTLMLAAERATDTRVFEAMLLCDVHAVQKPEVTQALVPMQLPSVANAMPDNVMPLRHRA